MPIKSIESLVEGGKATAAPPLGPALGPLGVNIGQVVAEINKKTASFKGMQVPVKITCDTDTKEFTITVGTPPAAALLLKEAGIPKGSGSPKVDAVANLRIEQIIKVAKMKEDKLLGASLKAKVKEVLGTCVSMGIMVDHRRANDAIKEVDAGRYDKEIKAEKTELTAEELKAIEEEQHRLAEDLKKRRAEYLQKGKEIIDALAGKPTSEVKAKMLEAKIPLVIIHELMPEKAKAEEGKGGPAPAGAPAAAPAAAAKKK